jgi:tRNA A-37 threonylcarbamoyl transferase component Bud32
MITRRVAFSFENRNSSVSFLAAEGSLLFVGLQNGAINGFNIKDATIFKTTLYHENAVSGIIAAGDVLYSSGLDGRLVKSLPLASFEASNVYNSNDLPINSMALYDDIFLLLTGDFEILLLPQNASIKATKKIVSQTPINCITVADDYILAGARSGSVFAWGIESLEPAFELKGHTSQVNNILADYDILYSASDDKSIIQWSLFDQTLLKTLRRTSASAIGHLGPVNLLSMCNGVLFSAGSDTTTRRWNTESGINEDVYFGFSKPVTSVLCYNGSVFAGSEDFSVLMFNPRLPDKPPPRPSRSRTTEKSRIPGKTRVVLRPNRNLPRGSNQTQLTLVLIVSMAVVLILVGACFFYYGSKRKSTTSPALTTDALESTATATDLATVVNSVMGISKHGAFLIPGSTVARLKKIAAGGGGELFLAKLMDPIHIKNSNQTVVQKVVFMGSKNIEEAFYQEVGIMIMLSSFPHFCKIIAYTENPLSMILQYYPDGSLYEWLIKNRTAKILTYVKVAKDIAEALNTMHSHYLAHCDLKPQNVLVQIVHGIPSCFLTDFGITQILSDAILAARTFRVSTLGGLSIHYAAPEAFQKFRKKEVKGVDHTKFDIYSFGCIIYELVARRSPWK